MSDLNKLDSVPNDGEKDIESGEDNDGQINHTTVQGVDAPSASETNLQFRDPVQAVQEPIQDQNLVQTDNVNTGNEPENQKDQKLVSVQEQPIEPVKNVENRADSDEAVVEVVQIQQEPETNDLNQPTVLDLDAMEINKQKRKELRRQQQDKVPEILKQNNNQMRKSNSPQKLGQARTFEEIETELNDMFKQVVVNRDWKNKEQELVEMYNADSKSKDAIVDCLKIIMLKIMVIPQNQQKSAEELIKVFCKVYSIFAQFCSDNMKVIDLEQKPDEVEEQPIFKLFHVHMECAFKLTQQKQKNGIMRAFQWLQSIVDATPIEFWREVKKRIVKSVFTHSVYNAVTENPQIKSDIFRIQAMKIAGKFQHISLMKDYDEYLKIIRNHFIKMMMEEQNEKLRLEAVKQVHLGKKQDVDDHLGLKLFLMKSLDRNVQIRRTVYKRLLTEEFKFHFFKEEDRIQLILNGLKDPDHDVIMLCKSYLQQQICAKDKEKPKVADVLDEEEKSSQVDDNENDNEVEQISQCKIKQRIYDPDQLVSLKQALKPLNLLQSQSYKDPRISECVNLLLRDVIMQTYPMVMIDSYLESVVATNFSSYKKTGNLEALWEDLIFMNYILHFKQLIKQNPDQKLEEFSKFDYSVHIPDVKLICDLIDKCIKTHIYRAQETIQHQESGMVRSTFKDTIGICCINILLKTCAYLVQILTSDLEKYTDDFEYLQKYLRNFLLRYEFFGTSKKDTQDMKNPIQDHFETEHKSVKVVIYTKDIDSLMKQGMGLIKNLIGVKEFEAQMHSDIVAFDDVDKNDMLRVLHQIKMLKAFLQSSKIEQNIPKAHKSEKDSQEKNQNEQGPAKESEKVGPENVEENKDEEIISEQQQVRNGRLEQYENLIMLNLLKNPDNYEGGQKKAAKKGQFKAFECLSLIMISDLKIFKKHQNMLIGYIQNEQNDRKKSPMIYVAIKCLFDCIMVNSFMLETDKDLQQQRADLRKLLLRQLRDMDYNVRYLATEGFCKLLMCERLHNPQDYIARLILLKFDRPPKEVDSTIQNQQQKAGVPSEKKTDVQKDQIEKAKTHQLIKKTLEDFFTHYVRLSHVRCNEICLGTLQSVYYLIKGKANGTIDPSFANINHFYLFGTMLDLLKYSHNQQFAIFDLSTTHQSYHFTLLHFFSYVPLIEQLQPQETTSFLQFLVNSLQFFDFQEFPLLSQDFSKDFTSLLNPIFKLVYYKFDMGQDEEDLNQVKNAWLDLAEVYKKRLVEMMPVDDEGVKGEAFREKGKQWIQKELKDPRHEYDQSKLRDKVCGVKSDVPELFNFCVMFYNQMIKSSDFSEQKVALESDRDIQKGFEAKNQNNLNKNKADGNDQLQIIGGENQDYRKDARKAMKTLNDKKNLATAILGKINQNKIGGAVDDPLAPKIEVKGRGRGRGRGRGSRGGRGGNQDGGTPKKRRKNQQVDVQA